MASNARWMMCDRPSDHELQADARLSLAELGRRVGCRRRPSPTALRNLEERGTITGYRRESSRTRSATRSRPSSASGPAPRMITKVADLARATPEVVECLRITGEDCFIMRVHMRDVGHLEELIDAFVLYGQTTTSIVQSSAVPLRGVPVG